MLLSRGWSLIRAARLVSAETRGIQRRHMAGTSDIRPTNFQKWLLVHFKKYPKGQVPEHVPMETMARITDMARIKFSVVMGVGTLFGIFLAIYIGKRQASQGISLSKMNKDWHEQLKRKHEEEIAAANKK